MSINAGTVVGYLELDASKFKSGLNTAMEQLKGFTDKSNSAGTRFQALGSSLKTIGSNMSKYVTLPLAGIGTASVATAANFEKSMSQVAATMGMTAEEINNGSESYKKLEQAALDMGATTQFSASEASEALNYLALAGYDVDKSVSTLPTVLNLAAAGGLELGYASDVMTDAMSALSLETSQAELFVDQLAKTSQKSNTNVAQLGEAILTVGGTAKVLSGGTTELNTALGILADNGIKGAEGGTALRNIILALTPSTDKAVAAFKKLGVETYDANGNLRPINETFAEMEGKLKNLSQEERTRGLSDIFNKTDLKSVNALLANSGERFDELSGYIDNASGAAADMADTMNNNLSGQLTLLKSGLEGAAISIGNSLMPVIKVLVEWINNLVTWFNNLNPGIQTAITIFGLVVAAIGPVLLIVGQLCIAIGGLITFFGAGGAGAGILSAAIAAITGPIGITIAAITALIAIGVLLYKNWDEIKAKCTQIWQNNIKPTVEKVTNTLKSFLSAAWNGIKAFLATCWELLGKLASTIWNGIKNSIETVCNTIKNVVTTIWNGIKTATSSVWEGIKTLISSVVNSIKSVIESVFSSIKAVVSNIFNGIKSVISTVWSAIQSAVTTYVNAVRSVIQSVFSAIQGIISATSNGWKATIQAVWNGIKSVVSTGVNAVKSVISSVWSGLQSILVAPFKAAQSVISGILSGISNSISTVKNAISSVKNAASSVVDKINPFKKSIEFIYSPQDPNTNARFRSDAINLARDLVYSDRSAKASVAESISNVTKSASSMVKDSNNPNIKPGNSVVINNTYNSPKPASIKELKRQDEMQMRRLSLQLGF